MYSRIFCIDISSLERGKKKLHRLVGASRGAGFGGRERELGSRRGNRATAIERKNHAVFGLFGARGGGAKNPLIMQRLTDLLPTWQVHSTTDYGLDADYVEAAAFAWLAYRRLNQLPSNLPSVTGAQSAVSLGVIYPKE